MPRVNTTIDPVRSLYAHVPYCQTICGYCDFYSEVLDRGWSGALVDCLLSELRGWDEPGRAFDTVFVGGGTPTTLPPGELARFLSALRERLAAGAEFTVEANPATVDAEVADVLVAAGVTRLSIGAQSFDPGELRVLDRIHKVADVGKTVAMVRRAGLRSVNLDLIFAIPGQTPAGWRKNLEAATALEPDHLSCYGLTYTKPTPLYDALQRGRVTRVDTDVEAEMYETTIDFLAAAGFEQYEISNFARPGEACRHNLACWHNRPYVGIGPSAAGLVDGTRYKNVPDTAEWSRALSEGRSPWIEREVLEPDQSARETMMLGLRLIEGVERAEFAERFGKDPAVLFSDAIARHVELGLLCIDERSIRLTRRGLLLADSVMADFV